MKKKRGGYRPGSGRKKGAIPWNKGLKGWTRGTKAGFQKGHSHFKGSEKGWFTTERTKGEKNINWKDGRKQGLGYPRDFIKLRKRILNMISTCSLCRDQIKNQTPSKHLVVHHKDGDINNNQLNNFQVLCNSCHRKVHRRGMPYGKKKTENCYIKR